MSRLSDRTARRTATVRRKVKVAARGGRGFPCSVRRSIFTSQLIDDEKGVTLAAASTLEKTMREGKRRAPTSKPPRLSAS